MIRVATIGTSMITRRFAAAVGEVQGIELACVYSRDGERAATVARELGAPTSESSLERLLDSPAIDAIYVASPNTLHHRQALAAIEAGKHVLVEKPATTSATQTAELVTAARGASVVFLEAIRSLYDPGYVLIRELLPRLGQIRRVTLRFHQRSPRYDRVLAGEAVNVFDPAMGGGALYDLGVYCAQALVHLFGEPDHVLSALVPVASGADGAGAALAVYPGFVADLSFSKITVSTLPNAIEGEHGTLLIDHVDDPRRLTLLTLDSAEEVFTVSKRGTDQLANMADCAERFVAAIGGDDIAEEQDRSITAARLIDSIRTVVS
ncbi:MAG: Gfo/Idh/MocA family oxidoreductase [Propionibacteriaceae bacterium]|nr:Gfo/Idh/MocA family oxidoreductase [Propionibacteriaceae bacterium]